MGKFEKFVVLAVLFLVTLILVVSLNTNEPEALAQASLVGNESETLDHAALVEGEEVIPDDPVELASEPITTEWSVVDSDESEPALLDLSTVLLSGHVEEKAPIVHAVMLPEGSIICDAMGLVETPDPSIFLYTSAKDDTYESLAIRYYGDASLPDMLVRANDDLGGQVTAATVLIPAFDRRVKRDDRRSGRTYTVKTGDTFTQISLDLYGDANLWLKIYEANEDVVFSPDGLRPGMILRIP